MAGVVVQMSADEAQLWRAQAKILNQQKQMSSEYRKVQKSAQGAGKSAKDAFGPKTQSNMTKTVGKLGLLAAALGTAAKAYGKLEEQARKGMESLEGVNDSRKKLAQLFKGEKLKQEIARGDRAAIAHGMTREQAGNLLFDAHSTGFAKGFEAVAATSPFITDMGAAGSIAGKVPGMFNGAVSSREAINATLAASQSSSLGFGEFAKAVPGAAAGTALTGATLAETEALLSTVSSRTKSAESAADAIATLATTLSKNEQFQSGGVIAAVESLQSDPALKGELITGDLVRKAYKFVLDDLALIKQRRAEIETAIAATGTAASPISQRTAAVQSNPAMMAILNKQRSEAQRDVALERRGMQQAAVEAARNRSVAENANRTSIERMGAAAGHMIGGKIAPLAGNRGGRVMKNAGTFGRGGLTLGIGGLMEGVRTLSAQAKRRDQLDAAAAAEMKTREAIIEALNSNVEALRERARLTAAEFNRDRKSAPAIRVKQRQAAGVE